MRLTFLKEYNFGLSEVVKCNKILRFCEKQNYLKSNKKSTRTLILKVVTVTQSALENRKDIHCNSIHKDIFQPKIGREVKPWPNDSLISVSLASNRLMDVTQLALTWSPNAEKPALTCVQICSRPLK